MKDGFMMSAVNELLSSSMLEREKVEARRWACGFGERECECEELPRLWALLFRLGPRKRGVCEEDRASGEWVLEVVKVAARLGAVGGRWGSGSGSGIVVRLVRLFGRFSVVWSCVVS